MESKSKQNTKEVDFNLSSYNPLLKFDTESFKFQHNTENYILKLNNISNLKFFKDELSIKYVGKGISSQADHAVR